MASKMAAPEMKDIQIYRQFIESAIRELVEKRPEAIPDRLWRSMAYSLMAGGKRVRPLLCLLSADSAGAGVTDVMPMAVACEMIHTASLIHDDLPCMDNDTLRRGKPTNHVVFGEALALLAGDSLFIWAFDFARKELLARGVFSPQRVLEALGELLGASGPFGICGGQVLDSDPSSFLGREEHPWKVSEAKTAALIRSSVLTGAILAGVAGNSLSAFSDFGYHLGISFQIVDDILDVTGDISGMGKTPGKDKDQGKLTFVEAFGLEKAKKLARLESESAMGALETISGKTDLLKIFLEILVKRTD